MEAPEELKGKITAIKKRIRQGNPYYSVYCEIPDHGITIDYNITVEGIRQMKDALGCDQIDDLIGREMLLKKKAA